VNRIIASTRVVTRWLIALFAASAAWVMVGVTPVVVASANGPTSITRSVPADQCAAMLDLLKGGTKVPAKYRAIFDNATPTSCQMTLTSSDQPPTAADALAGGCQGTWQVHTYSSFGIPYLWNHANIGTCFDYSSHTWRDWGPDCYVDSYFDITGVDWCGWLNNNTNNFHYGDNFWAARSPAPNIHKHGYDRWQIDPWHNVWWTEGGCCW
jgi:hypothetical protein